MSATTLTTVRPPAAIRFLQVITSAEHPRRSTEIVQVVNENPSSSNHRPTLSIVAYLKGRARLDPPQPDVRQAFDVHSSVGNSLGLPSSNATIASLGGPARAIYPGLRAIPLALKLRWPRSR